MNTITKTYTRISLSVSDAGENIYIQANESPIRELAGDVAFANGCTYESGIVSGFDHGATLLVTIGARSIDLSPTRVIVKVNEAVVGFSQGENGQPIVVNAEVNRGDTLSYFVDGMENATTLSANPTHSYLKIHELD